MSIDLKNQKCQACSGVRKGIDKTAVKVEESR